MTNSTVRLSLRIPDEQAGQRLDQALAALLPDFSRSRLKGWIETGGVLVDGAARRPRDKVSGGEAVEVSAVLHEEGAAQPQAMPLVIAHEDAHVLVIDKPAGLVVHPGAGNPQTARCRTHCSRATRRSRRCRVPASSIGSTRTRAACWSSRARPGAYGAGAALEEREIDRGYEAVCVGVMTAAARSTRRSAVIRTERIKMAVRPMGREAVTHYRSSAVSRPHAPARATRDRPYPPDPRASRPHRPPARRRPVYGGRRAPPGAGPELRAALASSSARRCMRRGSQLAHPVTWRPLEIEAPLPADMQTLPRLRGLGTSAAPWRHSSGSVNAAGPDERRGSSGSCAGLACAAGCARGASPLARRREPGALGRPQSGTARRRRRRAVVENRRRLRGGARAAGRAALARAGARHRGHRAHGRIDAGTLAASVADGDVASRAGGRCACVHGGRLPARAVLRP
jgi:23S rRNA pseudouridine1911/1915/1917 synthase